MDGNNCNLLDTINLPGDLRKLTSKEVGQLAAEIREFLVESVTKTGGHLASNLGVVELTLALYRVFDFPRDILVFDVGHQSYVHKILSGRKDAFAGLRQEGGISGFPKRDESAYDAFNTGHSSTSISAALGIARALAIKDAASGIKRGAKKKSGSRRVMAKRDAKRHVIALTGDGALTGGMCYEAMNDAGHSPDADNGRENAATFSGLIVILNDNEMSISDNVGSVSRYLSKIRTMPAYFFLRDDISATLEKIPVIGKPIANFISRVKNTIKYAVIPGAFFEELGFKYIGPVDGHDIKGLEKHLRGVADMRVPVLLHVLTKKGMGYPSAESDPKKYHGVSPIEINGNGGVSYSDAFGAALCKQAATDGNVVAISAAMTDGTGLRKFADTFPERFFDVGIAEQHALTLAAGMALYGLSPVAALYSTFLQRAYDQTLHDICLQNAHVVLAIDRAGVVGADGETHQGLYDIAFLRHMPNMTIMAPAHEEELTDMLHFALREVKGPTAIRYPKSGVCADDIKRKTYAVATPRGAKTVSAASVPCGAKTVSAAVSVPLVLGCAELVRAGRDITIIALGVMLDVALDLCAALIRDGYDPELISARFAKPIDEEMIAGSVKKTGILMTIEDGCAVGGFGSSVIECLAGREVKYDAAKLMGFPDKPINQGERKGLFEKYGLDAPALLNAAKSMMPGSKG